MATITITILDEPEGGVAVATDADTRRPSRRLTPAEALTLGLLGFAFETGATVIYDPRQVPLVALALDLIDPAIYGATVGQDIRARAKANLGPRMGQLVPAHLLDGVDIDAAHRDRPASEADAA